MEKNTNELYFTQHFGGKPIKIEIEKENNNIVDLNNHSKEVHAYRLFKLVEQIENIESEMLHNEVEDENSIYEVIDNESEFYDILCQNLKYEKFIINCKSNTIFAMLITILVYIYIGLFSTHHGYIELFFYLIICGIFTTPISQFISKKLFSKKLKYYENIYTKFKDEYDPKNYKIVLR